MEIGLGIHGEAGVRKGDIKSADEITTELMDLILKEQGFQQSGCTETECLVQIGKRAFVY